MEDPNDTSPDMEEILAQHLKNLESCFFGLTTNEFRKLAFELAAKFLIPLRFKKEENSRQKVVL